MLQAYNADQSKHFQLLLSPHWMRTTCSVSLDPVVFIVAMNPVLCVASIYSNFCLYV